MLPTCSRLIPAFVLAAVNAVVPVVFEILAEKGENYKTLLTVIKVTVLRYVQTMFATCNVAGPRCGTFSRYHVLSLVVGASLHHARRIHLLSLLSETSV